MSVVVTKSPTIMKRGVFNEVLMIFPFGKEAASFASSIKELLFKASLSIDSFYAATLVIVRLTKIHTRMILRLQMLHVEVG